MSDDVVLKLDDVIWRHIEHVLLINNYSISGAALDLGIARSSLQRRLRKRFGRAPRNGRYSRDALVFGRRA